MNKKIPSTFDFQFMSFELWRAMNPDLEEVEEECENCGGTGDCECHCGDVHDCKDCDGTGICVELTLKEMYNIQLKKDIKLAGKYLDKVITPTFQSPNPSTQDNYPIQQLGLDAVNLDNVSLYEDRFKK
jgi:hypothetical protein